MLKKINFKAVLLGFIADIVISALVGVVIVVLYAIVLASKNLSLSELIQLSDTAVYTNIPIMITSLVFGLLATLIGGFITGRIAKKNFSENSLTLGILGFILSLPFAKELPTWYNAFAFILIIPSAYLGGDLAKKYLKNKKTKK